MLRVLRRNMARVRVVPWSLMQEHAGEMMLAELNSSAPSDSCSTPEAKAWSR